MHVQLMHHNFISVYTTPQHFVKFQEFFRKCLFDAETIHTQEQYGTSSPDYLIFI
jgi:hypothetical protein